MAPATWVHHHHHPPPPNPTPPRNYDPGYYNRHGPGNSVLSNVQQYWNQPGVTPVTPLRGGQTGEDGYFQGSLIPVYWVAIEPGPTQGNPTTGVGYSATQIAKMKTYTAAAAAVGLKIWFMIVDRSYTSDAPPTSSGTYNACPAYMEDGQTVTGGVPPIAITWNATLAANATSGTLTANWAQATGSWKTMFTETAAPNNTEELMVAFTHGSKTATFSGGSGTGGGLKKQCQAGGSWVPLAISVPTVDGYGAIRWDQTLYVPSYNNLIKYLSSQFDNDPGLEGFMFQESALGHTQNTYNDQAYGPYSASLMVTAYNAMITNQMSVTTQAACYWGFNFLQGGQGITSPCIGDILSTCAALGASAGGPDCLPNSASLTPPPAGAAYHWYDTLANGGFYGGPGTPGQTGGVKLGIQISPPSYNTSGYGYTALYNFMKDTAGPLSNSLHCNYCFPYIDNAGSSFTWNDWATNIMNLVQYIESP